MSSVSEFSLQQKAVSTGSGNGINEKKNLNLINLNQVFQTSLELYQDTLKNSAPVIRCDNLPAVSGDPVQMLKLFNLMLKMVLLNLPLTGNSFIYVKCELNKEPDMTPQNGIKNFIISMYSNTIHIKEWIHNFQQELHECISTQLKARFQEHTISETGCLYSLSLPGKIN